MDSNSQKLAIIPARGNSKRLPRKNIVDVNGKPLIAYTIEHALSSKMFEKVIVSTEDPEIAKVAEKYGAEAPFLRPEHLSTDHSTVADVCEDLLNQLEDKGSSFSFFCCLYATNPLRDSADIKSAFRLLLEKQANFSTGITQYHYSPFQALSKDKDGYLSMVWPKEGLKQSQAQPEVFVDNGSMYWVTTEAFRKYKDFYGPKHVGYLMPWQKSIDINTQADLELLKKVMADG